MPEVKCSVSNCNYWEKGNNCNAKAIMIEVDQHAAVAYDSEFAADFEDHKDKASSVRNTCCHTFEPRNKK
ncbi:DUF1540 domain-containing protein [Paenibacillus sp. P26]|nr:DUF1540 domain-containing protein [Paenibacillus sp. P26]UUZ96118.1 DUF1540 domain-containing protein [Paenibacillus sp. P25]